MSTPAGSTAAAGCENAGSLKGECFETVILQVESVKLSSESALRAMEAELAHARREAATVAASHKNDLANWQVSG